MSWCHVQVCPNPKCKKFVDVCLVRDEMPASDEQFAYKCPHCGNRIVLIFPAFAKVKELPKGAVTVAPIE
jgi:DNA-directed RNA polymerase subunit RPC12/RpoP